MQVGATDEYIHRAFQHLDELRQSGQPLPAQYQQALEELEVALIQLKITNEELADKNLELASEHQRFQELFNLAPDGFLVTDPRGLIQEVNRAAATLLNIGQEELVGKPLVVYIAAPDRRDFMGRLNQLRVALIEKWDLHLQARQQQTFAVICQVAAAHYQTDRTPRLYWLLHDVSERDRMQRELTELNAQLEARVKERTAELARAHAQTRLLSQRLVTALEEERRRISRELHDEAGQVLVAVKMGLDQVQKQLPAEQAGLHEEIEAAGQLAIGTMEQLRQLAHDLRPPSVDMVDLNTLLEGHCDEVSRRAPMRVDYRGPSNLPALDTLVKITLYRILQESLSNAVKHSGATRVNVQVEVADADIILRVEDNGNGFNVEQVLQEADPSSGIGLIGMKERVEMLGGCLELDSEITRGTRVAAHVPIK